eukprot:3858759-Amphidinium_carterae.1
MALWSQQPRGLSMLAKHLPADLNDLHLGLGGCKAGDEAIGILAAGLPLQLDHLTLDLSGCPLFDAGPDDPPPLPPSVRNEQTKRQNAALEGKQT